MIKPKALERLERAVKGAHAAAMMCKGNNWTLHEEIIREKEDTAKDLKTYGGSMVGRGKQMNRNARTTEEEIP